MSLNKVKKILYFLFISAVIAFVASVSSPIKVKSETNYGYKMITETFQDAVTGDVKTYNFGYSDMLFKDNKENGTLAKASMGLAAKTYSTAREITDLTEKQLGFSVLYQANYDRVATEFDCDFVAYTIAAKNVKYDGKSFTLYGIFIRGTAQNAEWYSNFDVGDGSVHRGFDVASEEIYTNLKKIISDRETSKIWITGHSRGASVGNLLAAKINADESVAYRKNVCAYNFACPATTTKPIAYNNIFNYDIAGDIVAGIPLSSWGFSRHGITFEFDIGLNDVAHASFKEKTSIDYEGRDEIMEFSAAMEKWCPTQESYNEPKYGGLGSSPHDLIKKVIPLLMGEEMKQLTLMDVGLNLNALSALLYFQQNQTSIVHGHAPVSYLCYIDAMYPHEHVYEYVSDNNATCTDDGTLTGTCYCGYVAKGITNKGSAIGHSFLISIDDNGIITYTCEHCGIKIYGRDISYANASEIKSYEYLGENIEPDVTLEFMGEILVEGEDYEKSYFDNDAPGTGKIVITGINKYTDSKVIYFTISEHKHTFGSYLSNLNASCEKDGTKTAVCAVCGEKDTVTDKGSALEHVYLEEEGTDGVCFVCSRCGDAIVGRDLSYAEVSRIMDAEYLGEPLTCNPRVYFLKTLLKEGVDYELSYENNDCVGICTVTITGIGKYTGSTITTFKITDHTHDFGSYEYNDDATCEKNGTETAVCVTCGETYTREVEFTALGHDYVEKEQPQSPDFSDKPVTPDVTPTPTQTPTPTVSPDLVRFYKQNELKSNGDSSDVKNDEENGEDEPNNPDNPELPDEPEEETAIIYYECTRCGDTFTGKDIAHSYIMPLDEYVYYGNPVEPDPEILFLGEPLIKGIDYTISYEHNDVPGEGRITIVGIGDFTGERTFTFTIIDHDHEFVHYVSDGNATCLKDGTQTAKCEICDAVDVKTDKDSALGHEYEKVEGDDGIINYSCIRCDDEYREYDISHAVIEDIGTVEYFGKPVKPEVKVYFHDVLLKEGNDYTVEYSSNDGAGTGVVTVTGKGVFLGKKSAQFTIVPHKVVVDNFIYNNDATCTEDGTKTPIDPVTGEPIYELTVTDPGTALGHDYVGKDIKDGIEKLICSRCGDEIEKIHLEYALIKIPDSAVSDGKLIENAVTVTVGGRTLEKDKDYVMSVKYKTADNVLTITIKLSGTGNAYGEYKYVLEIPLETDKEFDFVPIIIIVAICAAVVVGGAASVVFIQKRINKK